MFGDAAVERGLEAGHALGPGGGGLAAAPPRAKADQERSMRLLRAIDEAVDDGQPGELSEFERIVLFGVAGPPGQEYPPPGHGYPRS
ncbi:hypothetical protein [Streptomyces sp. NPDC059957]|uniref:hypothetical protein n=1 Tax=Streptomyces sp. NPDC059957 TaxID=3347016 RepID=UPI00364C24E3